MAWLEERVEEALALVKKTDDKRELDEADELVLRPAVDIKDAETDSIASTAGEHSAGLMSSVSAAQSGEQHERKKAVACCLWQPSAR